MMKRYCLVLLSFFISLFTFAQIQDPVKWSYSSKKISDNEAELIITAKIEKGWHLYSQYIAEGGPVKTTFTFNPSPSYKLIGKTTEGKPHEMHDPNFDMDLKYFEDKAVFKQKIKVIDTKPFTIKGVLEFMVCDDHQCLPPEQPEFEIKVEGGSRIINESNPELNKAKPDTQKKGKVIQKWTSDNGNDSSSNTEIAKQENATEPKKTTNIETTEIKGRSFWSIFFEGFGWGLAALLTPCVFPMIPMNVSFFLKRSKDKKKGIQNALVYALFIIIIYVTLGFLISKIFGPDALNALSTDPYFNLFFFFLLIIFAASFLGAFEIVLPSSFINKVDSKSERGGLLGIFFMAFTLSLVSFSCTGPLIGTALVRAATTGQVSGPVTIMGGFATGLALPFGLFAFFPSLMNSMPKSGGWLNSVKVVLGFLEIALALKFLSNADLVVQAGYITREVFITIWIVVFALMGAYLMGWFRLSHDSPVQHLSVTRLFFAIFSFAFTIYLIPGLWGAPLKLISGFPPPDFYSESPNGFSKAMVTNNSTNCDPAADKESAHCPNDLPCFHDYDEALAYAKKVNKPLMIDFTGWACVNCRKMESQVWTDHEVDKRLRNDVVLVSLYVDDKRALPADQQTEKELGGKKFKIKTIGNKWSYMQALKYKTNSQPQYILLDKNEEMLNEPTSYDPDIQKYINWLDNGKEEYAKRK